MRDVLHMRVSLAVLLIDDFTGRIITSSDAQVSVEGGRKPVVKREGFRVFTNLTEPEVRVRAGGPCYCEEEQAIDLRQLDRSLPVVRLRLRPNRWYPLPAGTARVSVQLPEDTQLLAYCQESGGYKRLLADYTKGSQEISLYQGDSEELEEKACCIMGKDGEPEPLRLGALKDREAGLYQLLQLPENAYKRAGTRVYPAACLPAGPARTCYLPLKGGGQKEPVYTFVQICGTRQTVQQVTLRTDRENRMEL